MKNIASTKKEKCFICSGNGAIEIALHKQLKANIHFYDKCPCCDGKGVVSIKQS